MALIKCPECGKEVSDRANACPDCGYPIKEHFDKMNNQVKENDKSEKNFANAIIAKLHRLKTKHFVIIGVVIVALLIATIGSIATQKNKSITAIGVEETEPEVDINNIVNQILYSDYTEVNEVAHLINSYYDEIPEVRKEDCLLVLAKHKILLKIIEEIKPTLKSPDSFNLYDFSFPNSVYVDSEGECTVTAEVKYGATNSFGAEITDTVTAICEFQLDLENGSVKYIDVSVYYV